MLKFIGAIIIVLAGDFLSRHAVRFEKKRLSVLDGWIDLIFYIRTQIDCYLMPLDEILATADKTLLQFAEDRSYQHTLASLFGATSPYLNTEGQRILRGMIREMGGSYREEQVKRCDFYLVSLRALREKLAAELPARLKLCTTLSLCTAVGTAILLW